MDEDGDIIFPNVRTWLEPVFFGIGWSAIYGPHGPW
jgi:hypothetical protein